MEDAIITLQNLNLRIGDAESEGDLKWLTDLIVPEFVFRRANGKIVGADEFLKGVQRGSSRATNIQSIEIHGMRAIVKCIVSMDNKNYHNIRLFVQNEENLWKLVAWANEPV